MRKCIAVIKRYIRRLFCGKTYIDAYGNTGTAEDFGLYPYSRWNKDRFPWEDEE